MYTTQNLPLLLLPFKTRTLSQEELVKRFSLKKFDFMSYLLCVSGVVNACSNRIIHVMFVNTLCFYFLDYNEYRYYIFLVKQKKKLYFYKTCTHDVCVYMKVSGCACRTSTCVSSSTLYARTGQC